MHSTDTFSCITPYIWMISEQKPDYFNLKTILIPWRFGSASDRMWFPRNISSTKFGQLKRIWTLYVLVKWGASRRWSSSLCCPMQNSDKLTIAKTHPTFKLKSYCENASLSIRCILLLSSEIFFAPESEMKVWFVISMKKFCPISTTSIDSSFCWLVIVEFNLEQNFRIIFNLIWVLMTDFGDGSMLATRPFHRNLLIVT